MAVSSISGGAPSTGAPSPLTDKVVSQNDFLKLLITQLQNQDPLQPMDNQQFAAQLAQFNSLGQLIEINDKLGAVNSGQGSLNKYNATSLIGKQVTAAGNLVAVNAGAPSTIGFELAANATKVVVTIFNANGETVRTIDAGALNAGDQSLSWDGKDSAGKSVAAGVYGIEITATDVNGVSVGAVGKITGLVTGVQLAGAEPVLEVNGVNLLLSSVIAVSSAN